MLMKRIMLLSMNLVSFIMTAFLFVVQPEKH
jgi:hypothetical protein